MSENSNETDKKAREPKKNSIPYTEIEQLVTGIDSYKKTSFLVVGHRDGVRLAIPLTTGVSRVYFYGDNNYDLVPTHDSIVEFTPEQRKEQRKGGIMAEVDFEKGLDGAREALKLLVDVVRNAPEPQKKLAKPKAPKKEKAVAAPKAAKSADDLGSPTDLESPDDAAATDQA